MLYIGADHAGYRLKEKIKTYLNTHNICYVDLGAEVMDSEDDYVDYALTVSEHVAGSKKDKGLLFCGTGNGMVIAANKIQGIRAAVSWSPYTAKKAVEDDHANIIALPARTITEKEAIGIAKAFLGAKPSQAKRHTRRVQKVNALV